MDYSQLSTVELTAVSTAFTVIDSALSDEALPECFPEMLVEYASMGEEERRELGQEMAKVANFRAYAEWLGNGDAAPALLKVADELADMKPRELAAVEAGGLGAVAAIAASKPAIKAEDA